MMIDLSNLAPVQLLKLYETALQEKLILIAHYRRMTVAGTYSPESVARTEDELSEQAGSDH